MQKKSSAVLKLAKLFSILLIMVAFIILFVFCTLLPRTESSQYDTLTEKPEFSFKGLLDGSYTMQWADYFSDSVHNRDWFKSTYGRIRSWFGMQTIGDDEEQEFTIGNTSSEPEASQPSASEPEVSIPEQSDPDVSQFTPSDDPIVSEPPDVSTPPEQPTGPEVELEGSLVLYNGRVMEIYGADVNLKYIPRFTEILNNFAESMPGVTVSSMVIPKQCAYYLAGSKKHGDKAGNTLKDLNAIEERLSDKVTSINIYDTLDKHKNEHIYFATDHHWTALGAYYACEKLASDLHLPFTDLSGYTVENRQGFLGTMYKYSGYDSNVEKLAEEFSMYKPNFSYTSQYYTNDTFQNPVSHDIFFNVSMEKNSLWYMMFINGDAYSWKIQSDACRNGRKVLVVKDSYGNALVPFLLSSFEEVYVVDARTFKLNLKTFVAEQGITDVLFAECAFSAKGNAYLNDLEALTK